MRGLRKRLQAAAVATVLATVATIVGAASAAAAEEPIEFLGCATSHVWVGPDGGAWSVPGNWEDLGVPADGDCVTFPDHLPSTIADSVQDIPGLALEGMELGMGHRIEGDLTLVGANGPVLLGIDGVFSSELAGLITIADGDNPAVIAPSGFGGYTYFDFTGGLAGPADRLLEIRSPAGLHAVTGFTEMTTGGFHGPSLRAPLPPMTVTVPEGSYLDADAPDALLDVDLTVAGTLYVRDAVQPVRSLHVDFGSLSAFDAGSVHVTDAWAFDGLRVQYDLGTAAMVVLEPGSTGGPLAGPLAITTFSAPTVGAVVTLIANETATPLTGTFVNAPEGGSVTDASGHRYAISYNGGDAVTAAYEGQFDPPAPLALPAALPHATEGRPYEAFIAATGGSPPYEYALVESELPSDFSLDPDTGALTSDFPFSVPGFTFTVQVTDLIGATATQEYSFQVVEAPSPDLGCAPDSTYTWLGIGGTDTWSTGANWDHGTAPGDGDCVVLSHADFDTTTVQDIAGLALEGIQISNRQFVDGPLTVIGANGAAVVSLATLDSGFLDLVTLAPVAATARFTTPGSSTNLPGGLSSPSGRALEVEGARLYEVTGVRAIDVLPLGNLALHQPLEAMPVTVGREAFLDTEATGVLDDVDLTVDGGALQMESFSTHVASLTTERGSRIRSGTGGVPTMTVDGAWDIGGLKAEIGVHSTIVLAEGSERAAPLSGRFALTTFETPSPGEVITLVDNQSTDDLGGTFVNAAEGTILTDPTGHQYELSYNDGRALTLTFLGQVDPPPALTLSGTALPGANVGSSYEYSFAATGGSQPYEYSFFPHPSFSMTLPPGLSLAPDGTLAGTPTTEGTTNFVVAVLDGNEDFTGGFFSLTVGPPLDVTPPLIDVSVDPTPPDGTNGWHVGDVTVDWTVSDPESSFVVSGCDDTTITTDASDTLTCEATSAGGTASESVTIKRDATAPTIGGAVEPGAPSASGWYTVAPTVSFSCSDDTSGIESCTAASTPGSSATAQSVPGAAQDQAGNTASTSVDGLLVDLVDPVVTCGVTPSFAVGAPGSVTATVTDAHSGPAAPTVSTVVDTSTPGSYSATLVGADAAGRTTTTSCSYVVQRIQPTLTEKPFTSQPPFQVGATLLTPDGTPIAGQTIVFTSGATVCSAVTNSAGTATCAADLFEILRILFRGYRAHYAGNATYLPVSTT